MEEHILHLSIFGKAKSCVRKNSQRGYGYGDSKQGDTVVGNRVFYQNRTASIISQNLEKPRKNVYNKKMERKSTRQILIEENLLLLKNNINVSSRNVNIMEDYVGGMTLEETGRKYKISKERVRAITVNYIAHCHQYLRTQKP